jgi:hypothetical protein
MLDYLHILFVKKDDLLPKLQSILKRKAFCGQESPEIEQLETFLEKFNDAVRFVIEFPYVDRHHRDTYYSFYSAKFNEIGRNCIRVHLFEEEITEADLVKKENTLDERYWGFFIIRPLLFHVLGRSLISPKAFKKEDYVCCLMKARVSLLGNELTVHGFPHIAKDVETHTCAESALWSYIEYFGSKYSQYKPLLPSQIIKTLMDNSEHRILPSKGLTKIELVKCLQDNGFQCQIYSINNTKIGDMMNFRMLQIYVESGIPLMLVLGNADNGHAILAIGHEENDSLYNVQNFPFPEGSSWADVSYFNKKLVFIDDNMPPYQIAEISNPAAFYSKPELSSMVIKSFIVPLPVHMFLVAEKAFALMEKILNDKKIGLQTNRGKWITRLLLTGSRSFKNFLFKEEKVLNPFLKNRLLHLPMPRFIWICEVYKAHEFKRDGHCSGLLILDPTSDGKSLASVLWYVLDKDMFIHDNVSWDPALFKKIVPFTMSVYRNNLKGVWNNWKS